MNEAAVNSPIAEEDLIRKRPLIEDAQIIDSKKKKVEGDRIKKKKVALLLCYSGLGYLGMQRNPGMKTIEEDLMKAMLKGNLISEEAYTTPQQIMFQRAARTDKGVSAARQVVSLKLPEKSKVEEINEHLPDQIRVLGIKRVTKGFNSKSTCDARTYSYMLPTFAFTPLGHAVVESFRISPQIMEKVKETLKLFEGTHNFHNFTSRRKPMDPSNNRYIMSFTAEEPFMSGGLEFMILKVKGQSFMLHQIRKMVGLTIAIVCGITAVETMSRAWKTTERLDIPVAPGAGLVLEEIHYGRYNLRFGSDGIHECLDWHEFDDAVANFKNKFIHPAIVETETEEKLMLNWLVSLPLHSYDVRENHVNDTKTVGQEEGIKDTSCS